MTGFCQICGTPFESGKCPSGHSAASTSRGTALSLPKPSTPRRLIGSGIEYFAYLAGIWIVTLMDLFSVGVVGFACLVFVGLIVLRDCNGGAFNIAKRVSHMRVVDWRTGQTASNAQALTRNIYYIILPLLAILPIVDLFTSSLFTVFVAVDVMMILANPKGRRLGDLLAGTQVIEARI